MRGRGWGWVGNLCRHLPCRVVGGRFSCRVNGSTRGLLRAQPLHVNVSCFVCGLIAMGGHIGTFWVILKFFWESVSRDPLANVLIVVEGFFIYLISEAARPSVLANELIN